VRWELNVVRSSSDPRKLNVPVNLSHRRQTVICTAYRKLLGSHELRSKDVHPSGVDSAGIELKLFTHWLRCLSCICKNKIGVMIRHYS
jgi:hypothetical protein